MLEADDFIKSVKVGDIIRYLPTVGEVREYEVNELASKFEPGFTCVKKNNNEPGYIATYVYHSKIREKINKLQLVGGSNG